MRLWRTYNRLTNNFHSSVLNDFNKFAIPLFERGCIESFMTEKCLWCLGQSEVAVHAQHVFEKTQKLVDRVSFGLVKILIKIRMNPDHGYNDCI